MSLTFFQDDCGSVLTSRIRPRIPNDNERVSDNITPINLSFTP